MTTEKKSRLGRGLDALLGQDGAEPTTGGRSEVSLDSIDANPNQPRKAFDDDELESLSASIRNCGILQPLVVRQVGQRYQLIAGERRLRAARTAGLAQVPVTVVDFNDQQVMEAALVENIQRADLNPIEKAQGFKDYLARYAMTHDQLASRLGLGRATITNLVALLDLPEPVQRMVRAGELSAGHGKALKGVPDPDRQVSLSKEIFARGLSVRAAEALVQQLAAEEKAGAGVEPAEPEPGADSPDGTEAMASSAIEKTPFIQGVEDELRQKLGLKVEIKQKARDRGQVILWFESNDDFERVLEALRK